MHTELFTPATEPVMARAGLRHWAVVMSLLPLWSALHAQTSPYTVGASVNVLHESNLYKLSEGAPPLPGVLTPADTTTTSSALLGFDQTFGRQRLRAEGQLRAIRFGNNTDLNHQSYSFKLGADWASINNLSGSLNLLADKTMVRFTNDSIAANNLQKNLATTHIADGTVRLGVVTRWTVEGTYAFQSSDYSAASYAPRAYRQSSLSAGVRYMPSGALSLGLAARDTRGRYPRFALTQDGQAIADHYGSRNLDLSARWSISALSQFDTRLSWGSTRFDRATAGNTSGLTGVASWTWRPTGKLRFETRLARERGQEATELNFAASGRVVDISRTTTSLLIGANYELSAKVAMVAGLGYSRRDLIDTRTGFFGLDANTQHGKDSTQLLTLGARWAPTRSLMLSCDASWEQRHAQSALSTTYNARTLGCSGQFALQ